MLKSVVSNLGKEKTPKYVVKEKFLCEFKKEGMWNTYKIIAAPQKGLEKFVKSNAFNQVEQYAFYKSNADVIEFESNTRGLVFADNSFVMCPNLKCLKWINSTYFTKDFIKDCPKFDTLTFNTVLAFPYDFTSGQLRTFTQLKNVVFEESLNFKYNSSSFSSSTKLIAKPKGFKSYEI